MVNLNQSVQLQKSIDSGSFERNKQNQLTKILEYSGQSIYSRSKKRMLKPNSQEKVQQSFSGNSQSAERQRKNFNFKSDEIALRSDSRAG